MNRQLFTVIALALTMALFAACGDDSTPPDDTGPKDTFETNDDAQIKDPTIVDENFRVIYGYTPTLSEKAAEMMVGNPAFGPDDDGVPQWTSDFPLVKNSLESLGLNCSYGCYPSRDLGMMAVATGYDASTTGQDVQVVKFDQNMTASPLLMQPLTGVRQAYFVGGALVVSRFHSCETGTGATKTCYRFERVDFSDESVEPAAEELFVFPTDAMLEDSMYSGRFRVGADGRSLIIQNPEKESVSLWIYTSSEGLRQIGDRICQTVDANGDCAYSSTAPALTDDSPVALTKDGKTLLFAYVDDDTEFRIASFDTATGDTESTTLVKTPANYLTNVCYNFTGDWKYTRIQPPLLISADGAEVVFVAASECKPGVDKTLTDIIAVPLEKIGDQVPTMGTFFRKITSFPHEASAACVSILKDSLDISESGRFVTFVGTPRYDSSGRALADDSPQHYSDREVFVTAFDGLSAPVQISGNGGYRASSVLCSVQNPWFASETDPEIADR